MRVRDFHAAEAERRATTAAVVALVLGALSLGLAAFTWRVRRHLDSEITVALVDASVTLTLGVIALRGRPRRRQHALSVLAALAVVGVATGRWFGAPVLVSLLGLAAAVVYARGARALASVGTRPPRGEYRP